MISTLTRTSSLRDQVSVLDKSDPEGDQCLLFARETLGIQVEVEYAIALNVGEEVDPPSRLPLFLTSRRCTKGARGLEGEQSMHAVSPKRQAPSHLDNPGKIELRSELFLSSSGRSRVEIDG